MKDPPKSERRVAVRWNSTQQAPCHFATVERIAARWASVVDVSSQGIGLIVPCELEPGKELIIEIPTKQLTTPTAIVAQVVHAKPHSAGNWLIGCTFVRPLSQMEIDALL